MSLRKLEKFFVFLLFQSLSVPKLVTQIKIEALLTIIGKSLWEFLSS